MSGFSEVCWGGDSGLGGAARIYEVIGKLFQRVSMTKV